MEPGNLVQFRSVGGCATAACRAATLFCAMVWLSTSPAVGETEGEIRLQQDMLIWTTDYEGLIDGKLGPETTKAINKFQDRLGHPTTGRLTPTELDELVRQGRFKKNQAGFRQRTDYDAGVSVGIPENLVSGPKRTKWGGTWSGRRADLTIDTLRFGSDVSFRDLYDRLIRINNREVTYTRFVDGDWFVIAAFEADAAVYVRANVVTLPNQESEIRGFSIWMGKDRPTDYDALPAAMLSSFTSITAGTPPSARAPRQPEASVPPPALPRNPSPIRAEGSPPSVGDCFRGLGRDCPPVLTFR
jgi:peptidoglycan hydrolase-like protein with peptidoglycan-binding domain